MNKKLLVFLILFTLLLSFNVSAAIFITSSDLNITEEVTQNLYAIGGNINISAPIERDLVLIGGEIEINSPVKRDFSAIGSNIVINKDIKEDLRIIGSNININSDLEGDVIIIGAKVFISKDVKIDKKAIIIAGEVEINGVLIDGVKITASKVIINGEIYGDNVINTDKLVFGNNGLIKGTLNVSKNADFNDIEKVQGTINFIEKQVKERSTFASIYNFLALFVFGLVFMWLFGKVIDRSDAFIVNNTLKSLIVGLIAFIFIPILAFILLITIIGLPIALILFALYLVMILFSFIIIPYRIGRIIMGLFNVNNRILCLLVGLVIFLILIALPYLGGLVVFLSLIIGSGSFILLFTKQSVTKKKSKRKKTKRK
jgi:hypothetical protein